MSDRIRYAIDTDTGMVVSHNMTTHEFCWPILDFAGIGQGGNGFAKGDFNGPMNYKLEKIASRDASCSSLIFTVKVPLKDKNLHRQFWGMKPIRRAPKDYEREDVVREIGEAYGHPCILTRTQCGKAVRVNAV